MQQQYSINELICWSSNKNINPKTKRKIKSSGKKFKEIQEVFLSTFKEGINPLLIIDNKDPISQDNIWVYDDQKNKVYGDIPPNRLVVYQDNNSFYRGFDANSLVMLKKSGNNKHPITGDVIPEIIFQIASERALIIKEDKSEEDKIKDLAFSVFQKLSFESVYISESFFLDFNENILNKLNYELSELYNDNLKDDQKQKVDPNNKIFQKSNLFFNKMKLLEKKQYLLTQLDLMLNAPKELKMIVCYIITGSLNIVSPKIRELYPDIAFSFLV